MRDLENMDIEFKEYRPDTMLYALKIQPSIIEEIKAVQKEDKHLQALIEKTKASDKTDFTIKEDGSFWCNGRLCVPDNLELKKKIMKEAHSTPYTAHL